MNLLNNNYVIAPFLGMLIAQATKIVVSYFTNGKLSLHRFKETGGMPSSHSATVSALITVCAIQEGVTSIAFGISFTFGLIVMHDAIGIRQAAGRQAAAINNLKKEFETLSEKELDIKVLKTLLGHTLPQVIVGALLGVVIGFLTSYIINPYL